MKFPSIRVGLRLLAWVFLLAAGCSPAQTAKVLSQAEATESAATHVLAWAMQHGLSPADIAMVAKAIETKDYESAVPALAKFVDASIAAGDIPDADTQAFLRLAEQVVAVEAIQNGTRALSGMPP